MLSFAGLIVGIVALIGGGTLLVRGASEIATSFGVSPLIVGLTVVGFGTSAPELIINVVGALRGETEIAFGNVVGSNISNLALVLGAAVVIAPIRIQGQLVRREVPLLLLATTIMVVMSLDQQLEGLPAMIGRSEGVILLSLFCIFAYVNVLDFVETRHSDQLIADIAHNPLIQTDSHSRFRWLFVIGGLGLLLFGGEITVRNGAAIADSFGVSPTIVGLFLVAVGTSMPELVTSIVAAIRGEADLALGNVVGSNIFNSLIVLPASSLISQIPVPSGGVGDLLLSLFLTAILVPIFIFGDARLGRNIGVFLLLAYFGYAYIRIST
ncbi:MAG: calcium/sodium antiporter [Gammaproteobacteria bacterium]|nr:calcium/sodium antiporter [Gammaproteobacteria bacterium]MBT8111946.1 calcium/sodium antiporter [Gammaproteobacteria bacterium]NND48353.1 calcium/sodium antiporter [Woeseiaceae bacterium]NNL46645.1 calcium/sodium antiporter [Woeseiaceae bacterium]